MKKDGLLLGLFSCCHLPGRRSLGVHRDSRNVRPQTRYSREPALDGVNLKNWNQDFFGPRKYITS